MWASIRSIKAGIVTAEKGQLRAVTALNSASAKFGAEWDKTKKKATLNRRSVAQ
jgi:hypothetical protein